MRFVLVLLSLVLVAAEGAADTSRQEKAAYIIEAENFKNRIAAEMGEVINKSIETLNAALEKDLDRKTQDVIREEMKQVVTELVDDYIVDVVDVYLEHMTDAEVDALYGFYRSAEGKSIGGKLPEIGRKVYLIDARYLELLSARAVARIEKRLTEEGLE